jgi:hypothetical protein
MKGQDKKQGMQITVRSLPFRSTETRNKEKRIVAGDRMAVLQKQTKRKRAEVGIVSLRGDIHVFFVIDACGMH